MEQSQKDLVIDVLYEYMKSDGKFSIARLNANEKLKGENDEVLSRMISHFPKRYDGCIDVIFQLLSTVIEMKDLVLKFSCEGGDINDLLKRIILVEVKDYSK